MLETIPHTLIVRPQQKVRPTQATTERLTRLAELVDRGTLKVHVDKTFPLEQASAAMQYLENRAAKGKVVLKIA
jgi:NADPH:quinone reductase-like Zn-dependent oxidoreductase